MPDNKVKISNILNSLIPDFISQENPLFKEFLEQYYISEERDYGATNLTDNLAEYKKISYLSENNDNSRYSLLSSKSRPKSSRTSLILFL